MPVSLFPFYYQPPRHFPCTLPKRRPHNGVKQTGRAGITSAQCRSRSFICLSTLPLFPPRNLPLSFSRVLRAIWAGDKGDNGIICEVLYPHGLSAELMRSRAHSTTRVSGYCLRTREMREMRWGAAAAT